MLKMRRLTVSRLLADNHVRQRRGEKLRVLELVRGSAAVPHRVAAVEQQVTQVVRFLLVLLDGVAAPEPAPVALPVLDVPDVVARDVFAVLHRLRQRGTPCTDALVVADACEPLHQLPRAFMPRASTHGTGFRDRGTLGMTQCKVPSSRKAEASCRRKKVPQF